MQFTIYSVFLIWTCANVSFFKVNILQKSLLNQHEAQSRMTVLEQQVQTEACSVEYSQFLPNVLYTKHMSVI